MPLSNSFVNEMKGNVELTSVSISDDPAGGTSVTTTKVLAERFDLGRAPERIARNPSRSPDPTHESAEPPAWDAKNEIRPSTAGW